MTRRSIVVALATLLCVSAPLASQDRDANRKPVAPSNPPPTAARRPPIPDAAHPKYFTRILEVTSSGKRRLVFGSDQDRVPSLGGSDTTNNDAEIMFVQIRPSTRRRASNDAPGTDYANGEVDAQSRILIEFDRSWVTHHGIDGDLTVRGELQSGTSAPQIEVVGYSEVGKERQPTPARLRTSAPIIDMAQSLSRSIWDFRRKLDSLQDALEAPRSDTTPALAAIKMLRQKRDTLRARYEVGFLTRDTLEFNQPQNVLRRNELRSEIAEVDVQLGAERGSAAYRRVVLPTFFAQVRKLLIAHDVEFCSPAQTLLENPFSLRALAQNGRSDTVSMGAMLRFILRDVYDSLPQWLPGNIETNPAATDFAVDRLTKLRRVLEQLGSILNPPNDDGAGLPFGGLLLTDLRDAEILLSQIGAKAGDVVVLHVSDSTSAAGGRRQLDIRLRVRQFGFVRRLSDAVMLLQRKDVNAGFRDPRIDSTRTAFLSAGRADPVEDIPLPASFIPAAGGTLSWTYYERQTPDSKGSDFSRWLTPGFGVNVSFTSFSSKTVSFAPGDTVGAAPRETVTLSQDKVQVAAGPVITLFDNAVSFGVGWNLNVPTHKAFYSIGFSFVNIAERLGLGSKDKAGQ